ncbi:MAG: pyridoxal phosphate-dependent aminotransferase [Patescibacteria group bacterium]
MEIAERISRLGTEQAFNVLGRAKEEERKGVDMIHMEIGDTDFNTPKPIKDACIKAIEENQTHYLPSQGLYELREKIAPMLAKTRMIDVTPEDVIITPGGKPLILYTIMALINPGDEVLYPNPGYPAYESLINFFGGKAVPLPLLGEKNFNFDIEEFKSLVTDKTKLIIINSPQNPTGGVFTHESLEAIANVAKEKDLMVFSDEVYSQFVFEGEFESIASFPGMADRTIVLDAYTKTFSMSGWRLGYGYVPKEYMKVFGNLINNTVSCSPNFTQWAGIAGWDEESLAEVAKMRDALEKRRDIMVAELNTLEGVKCHTPGGAIYVFPDVSATGKKSSEIYETLFTKAHVACLAGTSFGQYGEGYIRLSFGNNGEERLKEGLDRIKKIWPEILN